MKNNKIEEPIYCKCTNDKRQKILIKGNLLCMGCWRPIEEPVKKN